MIRLVSYDIVFQEIPGEVTLALNISGCPNRCPGCHSPHLWEDIGEEMDEELLLGLVGKYSAGITCVCFMGGDKSSPIIAKSAALIKTASEGKMKVGWYSGKDNLPEGFSTENFNFIKLGRYAEELGGLDRETTNQRLYEVSDGELRDITHKFRSR